MCYDGRCERGFLHQASTSWSANSRALCRPLPPDARRRPASVGAPTMSDGTGEAGCASFWPAEDMRDVFACLMRESGSEDDASPRERAERAAAPGSAVATWQEHQRHQPESRSVADEVRPLTFPSWRFERCSTASAATPPAASAARRDSWLSVTSKTCALFKFCGL